MKKTKTYTVSVHYDVCFKVDVVAKDIHDAVRQAIDIVKDKDIEEGEIENVEAYLENIKEVK